jgi:DHA1 family bicyclomycin/chloramphenicol resistance-like MFS transporter
VRIALPHVYEPDFSVRLNFRPILSNFKTTLKNKQFTIYTFAGALSFAGLFVFVAGAPSIFFDEFKVDPKGFGLIFALLVGGLIGGGQLNHWLVKRFGSRRIFYTILLVEVFVSAIFFAGSATNSFGLVVTCIFLFILLACAGIAAPNASALAIEPFSKNIGSAVALLGFLQEGLGAIVSVSLGLLNGRGTFPTALVTFSAAALGLLILLNGKRSSDLI